MQFFWKSDLHNFAF